MLQNFQQFADQATLVDLSVPFLMTIWNHLEDDLLRAGINSVMSNNPRALCRVSSALQRILKPGFKPGETGYAPEGIIPVLGSFNECLNLSNMAQMLDRRLEFFLRVRSTESEFCGGEWGVEAICQKLNHLPMLDLAGLYFSDCPDYVQTGFFRRMLQEAHAPAPQMIMSLTGARQSGKDFRFFTHWENLALEPGIESCLPFEIGFWAFPVKKGADYQIFQADLGSLNGLRKEFPAQIAEQEARITEVWADRSEFVIAGQFAGPFPVRGYLTGGASHNPLDLRNWDKKDLQTIIASLNSCPVYLQKADQTIELMQNLAN